jgi:hypothetical protein
MTYTLKNYSAEMGLSTDFTEETLILSHKRIVEVNVELRQGKNNAWNEGYKKGLATGLNSANSQLISADRLKKMTLEQLSEFING